MKDSITIALWDIIIRFWDTDMIFNYSGYLAVF